MCLKFTRKILIMASGFSVLFATGTSQSNAQAPVVNCALFSTAADQARCFQANQNAARAYRNERLATGAYNAANYANTALGAGAGLVCRGCGAAYMAGN